MTDDLAAFIAARLDEDEAIARAALYGPEDQPWRPRGYDQVVQRGHRNADEMTDYLIADCGPLGSTRVRHIARHDPARVLREAEAKRARLALMTEATAEMDRLLADKHAGIVEQAMAIGRARAATVAVKHDAAVWSDHPDYRAGWRPQA